jgi:hypothetical protein
LPLDHKGRFLSALAKVDESAHDRCATAGSYRIVVRITHQKETIMSKRQHGNKEAKKPKKVHVPNPPGLPAGLAPKVASTLGPKRR